MIRINNKTEINIGFICSTYNSSLSTNHSLKLKNLNRKNVIKCVIRNLEDLIKLLNLSKKLNCKIFRIGSQFIPFASHPLFKKYWLNDIEKIIADYLTEIKKFNIRITMHPGQYVVLSTTDKKILKKSLDELKYHFWLLDKLEIDNNGIVVIHGGGIYGNKLLASRTLIKNINKNNWLKERLALENDEKNYNAKDILEICQELDLPFVFDYFHHNIFKSKIDFKKVFETWHKRIPEFHISSPGIKKYNHGNYVSKKDFNSFINFLKSYKQNNISRIDILLEARKKELAIIKLLKNFKNKKYIKYQKILKIK